MTEVDLAAQFMLIHRDTFMWLVGGSAVAIGGFVFNVFHKLNQLLNGNSEILKRHTKEKADDYGFGTVKIGNDMNEIRLGQEAQTRATKAMARLMQWTAEKQFGEKPPPLDLD